MINDYAINPAADTPRKFERSRPVVNTVLVAPVITPNANPVKFDIAACAYIVDGTFVSMPALAAQVFSAVHATGIAKWLGIGLYGDKNGRILTVGFPNTGDQDYDTEALALASIPAAPAGYCLIGIFTLLTAAADWDANTDALDAADLTANNLLGVQSDRRLFNTNLGYNYQIEDFSTWCRSAAGVANLGLFCAKQDTSGLITNPHIAVDTRTKTASASSIALRFGTFDYAIDGVIYNKPAVNGVAFTAAHVVALDKWGAILIQINAAGVISTLVSGATQVTPQTYANSAAARAALPEPAAGNVAIGVVVVEADNSAWTANADDMIAGSDLEAVDLIPALTDRVLTNPALSITAAEPEDFSVTAFDYVLEGVKLSKAATANLDFSAAHLCAIGKYLAILIQINGAGTISTRVPLISGRSQTASQGYDSFDEAVAALPNTEIGKLAIGYIVILADAGTWTANADDMTPGGDCEDSWLVGLDTGYKNGFSGIQSTGQNDLWPVSAAAFASSRPTAATLSSVAPAPERGWNSADVAIYAASVSGAVTDVRADWVHRPFPLNGEGGGS